MFFLFNKIYFIFSKSRTNEYSWWYTYFSISCALKKTYLICGQRWLRPDVQCDLSILCPLEAFLGPLPSMLWSGRLIWICAGYGPYKIGIHTMQLSKHEPPYQITLANCLWHMMASHCNQDSVFLYGTGSLINFVIDFLASVLISSIQFAIEKKKDIWYRNNVLRYLKRKKKRSISKESHSVFFLTN